MAYEAIDVLKRKRPNTRIARRGEAQAAARVQQRAQTQVSRRHTGRSLTAIILGTIFLGNLAAIVWLWLHNGGISSVHSGGDAATSAGRITGLLGTYALFVQVILLIRLPPLERL